MLLRNFFVTLFRRLFYPGDQQMVANRLYNALVAQARSPAFYLQGEVPDTVDGRFDMIVVHAFLVMHRLKDRGNKAKRISQWLFDEMFMDMDRALREMGVGDMGIGRKVRSMGKAFMGRVEAYDKALAGPPGALKEALGRNVYRGQSPNDEVLSLMASYLRTQIGLLNAQPLDALLAGEIAFGTPLQEETS